MSERFKRLFELEGNLFSQDSPVIVLAGALLHDTHSGNIIAQIKYQSISNVPIKALVVGIAAYDIAGKHIDDIKEYQYLDLDIRYGQKFGSNKAIVMPNTVVRSFEIKKITAVLNDGTIQNVTMPMQVLPKARKLLEIMNDSELVKEYQLSTNDEAIYVPCEQKPLWMCSCGTWNTTEVCSHCNLNKWSVFEQYNISALSEKMQLRLRNEKIEAMIKAEEKAKETEKINKLLRKSKIVACFLIPIFILYFAFSFWIYPDIIVPNALYNDAEELLLNGRYQEAEDIFNSLDDYKDSSLRANEAHYAIAEQLYFEGKYEEAIEEFESLGSFRDASDRVKEVKTSILDEQYNKANELLNENKYLEAIAEFEQLGNYKDAIEKIKEANTEIWNGRESLYPNITSELMNGELREFLVYLDLSFVWTGFSVADAKNADGTRFYLGDAMFWGETCEVYAFYSEEGVKSGYGKAVDIQLVLPKHYSKYQIKNKLNDIYNKKIALNEDPWGFSIMIPETDLELYIIDAGLAYIDRGD